jgi:hypothetical protein
MKTMEQLLAEIAELKKTNAELAEKATAAQNEAANLQAAVADAEAKAKTQTPPPAPAPAPAAQDKALTRAEVETIVAKAIAEGIAKAGIRSAPVGAGSGESVENVENAAKSPNLVEQYKALKTDAERSKFLVKHGAELDELIAGN